MFIDEFALHIDIIVVLDLPRAKTMMYTQIPDYYAGIVLWELDCRRYCSISTSSSLLRSVTRYLLSSSVEIGSAGHPQRYIELVHPAKNSPGTFRGSRSGPRVTL